jgi:HK97 family phage prohead protease
VGFDPAKGQMTEARLFQIQEIARAYGIPPAFLQDLSRGTFANVEQQDLNLVKHLVAQWATALEGEMNLKLFGRLNNNRYVEHNLDGLVRGDLVARMTALSQGVQNAILMPNEARGLRIAPASRAAMCCSSKARRSRSDRNPSPARRRRTRTEGRMTLETRTLSRPLEFRAGDSGKIIAGIAVAYDSETTIGDYFRERIMPGAFGASLKGDVRALMGHDSNIILGRTSAKTLRLNDAANALGFEIDLPDTQAGRDVATSIQRGDLQGMSFGFVVTKQEWDDTGPIPLRTVTEAELFEISVVGDPAYGDTTVALRSLDEARKEKHKHPGYTRIAERKARTEQVARNIR